MATIHKTDIDLNKNQILNARLHNIATTPSSPVVGQIIYNTTVNEPLVWNGSVWKSLFNTALNSKVESVTGVSGVPVNNADPQNPVIGLQDRLPLSFLNPNNIENPKWYMDNYENNRFVEIKRTINVGLDSLFPGSDRCLLQTDTHINVQSTGYMPIQTAIDFRSGRELRRYGTSNTTWSNWEEIGGVSNTYYFTVDLMNYHESTFYLNVDNVKLSSITAVKNPNQTSTYINGSIVATNNNITNSSTFSIGSTIKLVANSPCVVKLEFIR